MTVSQNLAEGEPCASVVSASKVRSGAGGFPIGLKARSEFVRVGKGRRFNARSLGLQVALRPDDDEVEPRFGLTVTKRVGNAVERNRIKRRLRAVLRHPGISPQAGHDYVIVARREALDLPFAGLVADLTRTLDQARSGRASKQRGRPVGKPSVKPNPLP